MKFIPVRKVLNYLIILTFIVFSFFIVFSQGNQESSNEPLASLATLDTTSLDQNAPTFGDCPAGHYVSGFERGGVGGDFECSSLAVALSGCSGNQYVSGVQSGGSVFKCTEASPPDTSTPVTPPPGTSTPGTQPPTCDPGYVFFNGSCKEKIFIGSSSTVQSGFLGSDGANQRIECNFDGELLVRRRREQASSGADGFNDITENVETITVNGAEVSAAVVITKEGRYEGRFECLFNIECNNASFQYAGKVQGNYYCYNLESNPNVFKVCNAGHYRSSNNTCTSCPVGLTNNGWANNNESQSIHQGIRCEKVLLNCNRGQYASNGACLKCSEATTTISNGRYTGAAVFGVSNGHSRKVKDACVFSCNDGYRPSVDKTICYPESACDRSGCPS